MNSTIQLIEQQAPNAKFIQVQGYNNKKGDWIITGYNFWCNNKMHTVRMTNGHVNNEDLQNLQVASSLAPARPAFQPYEPRDYRGSGLN